jgi:hypothetical protein
MDFGLSSPGASMVGWTMPEYFVSRSAPLPARSEFAKAVRDPPIANWIM